MTEIKMLPLPLTLRHPSDKDLADHVQTYARAVAEHNVKALQADMATLEQHLANAMGEVDRLDKRAERLAEALRELVALGHPRDPAIIAAKNALRDQEVGNG